MSYSGPDESLFRTHLEDSQEWQNPSFPGDFYHEADNVCRGVTLSPMEVPGPNQFKCFSDGDFYRDPDDVCRGISLGESFSSAQPFNKEFCLSSDLVCSATLSDKVDIHAERFLESDFPRPAPADSFFKLEATTLFVNSRMPFEIGNHLLDLLNEEFVSFVTKVGRSKFSIKGDVFMDSMMCTIKVRVYQQGADQFAIEFQRRSGDIIIFNAIFTRACIYLKSRLRMPTVIPEAAPMLPSCPPPSFPGDLRVHDEAHVQSILDMIGLVGSPWLQVEAATSLCNMAALGKPCLCSSQVFQALGELLKSSSTDAAYPTACLSYHLAEQLEAAPLFADHGIFSKLLEKICSQGVHEKIRVKLAQALNAAIQRQTTATLCQNAAAELCRTISDYVSKEKIGGAPSHELIENLEIGQITLEAKFGQ